MLRLPDRHAMLLCASCLLGLGAHCNGPNSAPEAPDSGTAGKAPPAAPEEPWLPKSVGYEIFVRSFADSNGDGSGDLRGVIERLDYLRGLGVDLIWLTPIHPSPSYHGYDVSDYTAIHPDFGTSADFDQLLAEAHGRGIRVFMDLVLNHTSSQHPWFAAARAGGPAASRYVFRKDVPGWTWLGRQVFRPLPAVPERGEAGGSYLALFGSGLPDLNLRDLETRRAFEDIAALWLDRGVDGFRLDAARYLVEWPDPATAPAQAQLAFADTQETHEFLLALRRSTAFRRASAALVGEVWTDLDTISRYHGAGDELHGCFSFPFAGALIDSLSRGTAAPLRVVLEAQAQSMAPAAFFLPFLSNHDQRRIASSISADALRVAAALLLSLPGAPFLYYGEEIGLLQSSAPGDRAQRQPMPWDVVAAQQRDASSLWRHYQRLIGLRRAHPALAASSLRVLFPRTPEDRLLVYLRGDAATGMAVLIYNLGAATLSDVQVALPSDYPLGPQRDLLREAAALPDVTKETRSRYPLPPLPPRSALWLTGTQH